MVHHEIYGIENGPNEIYDIKNGPSWTSWYWKWSNMKFTILKMVRHTIYDTENGPS